MLDLRPSRYDSADAVALTEQVQQYYVATYGGRDDDPITAGDFAPPHGGFVIGYLDGRPVAMGGWFFAGDGRAHVRRMFVVPELRRRGFAQEVLTALEDDARAAGAAELVLTTGLPQAAAVALYRAAGYVDVTPFGFYAGSGLAVHLGKRL